ncbi:hypothetical protein GQ42DRAFT_160583 [Ramicandelaber brevisporus]|nr:hypothetical protein GQ42DRAFT_160583 [Ramicandelaber brevisporus]
MEYSCCRIHMNFIGVNETIFPVSAWPTNEQLKADIKRAHDAGGIVIVNHISWSNATSTGFQVATLPNHPSVLELFEIGIDGVEVLHNDELDVYSWELIKQQRTALNSSSPLPSPPFPASPSSASDAPRYRTQPLLALSGMDWHYASPTYGWNVLKASNFSREAIMAELRAGRTSILAQQAGVRLSTAYPYSRPYYIFGPLSNLADYFGNFYTSRNGMPSFVNSTMCQTGGGVTVESGLIGATVVTLLILFVIYEAVRFTVLWLMRRFLPRVEHYFKDE